MVGLGLWVWERRGVEELQIKEIWHMDSTCLNYLSVVFFTTLKAKA